MSKRFRGPFAGGSRAISERLEEEEQGTGQSMFLSSLIKRDHGAKHPERDCGSAQPENKIGDLFPIDSGNKSPYKLLFFYIVKG
ncbi:hypothetical protein CHH75_16070 [Paenibacillus sp. 7541]|uniref:Uncharacterized protein n=1 Tax=Paenibacillus campinasensis TaxID=66347 RepID=A0A268EEM1_9BACL|nr:hypothetical protein CHH67_24150 [Paenibacillus campinasensis]PAK50750.1 hypothetical protein CHH75_16070 [Paenibacillus sp. 7541]